MFDSFGAVSRPPAGVVGGGEVAPEFIEFLAALWRMLTSGIIRARLPIWTTRDSFTATLLHYVSHFVWVHKL